MALAAPSHKTWSTHRSTFGQGTHRFDIVGYSAARAALGGDGGSVRSGSFHAGGFLWSLVCRLQDHSQRCGLASISLELSKNDTAKDVVVLASLRIGQFPSAVWRSDKARTFAARSSSAVAWELAVPNAFVDHEQRYVHAVADCLTIYCTVDVLLHEQHEGSIDATRNRNYSVVVVAPQPSISGDFRRLLWESRSPEPDVTFVVEDGTEIQAHKLVLAMRSPVFRAQFLRGDMIERSTRRLKMDGMSSSALKAMLYFIYTDGQPTPKRGRCVVTMAQELLVAADLYDLERLRLMCEKILSENINVCNVMATLMLVHGRQSCQQLEESCIEFMASGPGVYETVEATKEYKELDETFPSFINEVTKKVARRAVALLRSSSQSTSSCTDAGGRSIETTARSVSFYRPWAGMMGTHEFTIQNLSVVRKTHGVGQPIRSSSFQVGGYEWTIEVFPSGYTKDMADYIGIFIMPSIADNDTMVRASVALKAVDPTGESPPFSPKHFTETYVGKASRGIGWANFLTVASVDSHYMRHDGSFTIQCCVEVIMESFTSKTTDIVTAAAVLVPPSNMAWHLEQLLASEEGLDVKFLVEDSEIRAHGLVIAARSPALHEVMESATNTDHVRIDDMRAACFRAMIHFIYTDELPRVDTLVPADSRTSMTAVAGELLAAACRFRLDRMRCLCVNLLAENVTAVRSALGTAKMARCHNCPELEEYCRWYMSSPHVTNVTETCIDLLLDYPAGPHI